VEVDEYGKESLRGARYQSVGVGTEIKYKSLCCFKVEQRRNSYWGKGVTRAIIGKLSTKKAVEYSKCFQGFINRRKHKILICHLNSTFGLTLLKYLRYNSFILLRMKGFHMEIVYFDIDLDVNYKRVNDRITFSLDRAFNFIGGLR
jgi:ribosome biogenesis protein Nip4